MELPYELEAPESRRIALGLLVLQADEQIEEDFKILLPRERVRIYQSRLESPPEVTADSLPEMARVIPTAASLLPRDAGIKVVGYACTSGSAAMGEERVARLVDQGCPGALATNPMTSLKAALRALRLKRVGMVNPYIEEVSGRLCEVLEEEEGVRVTALGSFNQMADHLVARIDPRSILEASLVIGCDPACDCVVISCTNLQAAAILGEASARLGKPVLSSNQALAWHMLRLAGIEGPLPALGALADACVQREAAMT
jgi:maleate isomerase